MIEMNKAQIKAELLKGFGPLLGKDVDRQKIEEVCDCQNRHLPERPVNVVEIANEIGLQVYEASLVGGISGMLDRQEGKIYLEKSESARRKRFTCAHEVGHFLLHGSDYHDVVLLRSSRTDEIERAANSMAAEILMPKYFVKKFVSDDNHSPEELAEKFGVSEQAAKIRMSILETMGLT